MTREMEDAVLRTIARLDGTPLPSTAMLAMRWLRGRVARPAWWRRAEEEAWLETAYCAEVAAITYQAMGLLAGEHRPSWYDPGRFWSGDDLWDGVRLGGEIAVEIGPS